ncbi:MAG: deoxyribodipyrimidine photolyase [Marmoricola sp.]|nr:deoxyribodipyrimidine photolyase [Marmoricola sp.]
MTSIMWFRRDLRLRDNPALREATDRGPVLGLFVLDPVLWANAGPARRAWLAASLRSLDDSIDGQLCIRFGLPSSVVARMANDVHADQVHVSNEVTPYGRRRDRAVVEALPDGVEGIATGTPYAVSPGAVINGSGDPYKVFTPFSKAWRAHGWDDPVRAPREVDWVPFDDDERVAAMLDAALRDAPAGLPTPGEDAARRRLRSFLDRDLDGYAERRDDPGADRTSRLSPYLKLGVVHPRQLLAETARVSDDGARVFESELAWREFYADVLHHNPTSAWQDLRPVPGLTYDDHEDAIDAWKRGLTGYPVVDAGMRQLLAEGWMHNRVRMITASFLTKDLHVWWPVGARHFLDHLVDGDLASNNHGWQWVAGTGTDAAPYFRVFNPVAQGLRFDPDGEYVRRWVPELAHLAGGAAHQPWDVEGGYSQGYPGRIIDHAEERRVALDRYHRGRG